MEKVPPPLDNVELAGSTACPSLLVKCTVPLYPVATLPNGSSAVTPALNDNPAVTNPGALTEKCDAAAAETLMLLDVPVRLPRTASVALIVCAPAVTNVTPLVNECVPASPAVKL